MARPSDTNLDKSNQNTAQSRADDSVPGSARQEIIEAAAKRKTKKDRKRILVTGVNSLVGHSLFEQMRNDHLHIHSTKKPHKFSGSLIQGDKDTVPSPSTSIKTLDFKKKPKTFGRSVVKSDIMIVDLLSGSDLEEAEHLIQILKHPQQEAQNKKQVLILISSVFTWACTNVDDKSQALTDDQYQKRVPLPRYQQMKQLENMALTAAKFNDNLRVHIVCSGLPYGNGEANNVFYEFFRRAWLSLHPDLASLPVIGDGDNYIPTIHVVDLARFVSYLANDGSKVQKQYLVAVD